jgi:hypothetical protein
VLYYFYRTEKKSYGTVKKNLQKSKKTREKKKGRFYDSIEFFCKEKIKPK